MINKFIAIIPARGGSKEIKKKNLKLLGGKPLIYWTIKAAVDSKCFNSIIVSTDDAEIEDYCKKFELIIHKRPKKIAKDTTPMVPVVLDVFENYRDIFDKAEGFCLLQPTSPLRSATHLNEAIHLFNDSKAKSVLSVTKRNNKVAKYLIEEKSSLFGLMNDSAPFFRRQDLPNVVEANGAIYICSNKAFEKEKSFLIKKCIPYYMNQEISIDIDKMKDFQKAEKLIKNLI